MTHAYQARQETESRESPHAGRSARAGAGHVPARGQEDEGKEGGGEARPVTPGHPIARR